MAPLPAEMWKLLEDALNDPRSEAYEKLAAVPDATLETARALPGFSSHSFKQPLSQGLGETPLELHDSFLPSESSVLRSKRAAAASVGSPIATDQRKLARTESPSHQSPLAAPREPTDCSTELQHSSVRMSLSGACVHLLCISVFLCFSLFSSFLLIACERRLYCTCMLQSCTHTAV
jgi:hypothetical protein